MTFLRIVTHLDFNVGLFSPLVNLVLIASFTFPYPTACIQILETTHRILYLVGGGCSLGSCEFHGELGVPSVVLVSVEDPVFEPFCLVGIGDFWYIQSEKCVRETLGTNPERAAQSTHVPVRTLP